MLLLFLNSYHDNNKNTTAAFQMCQTIHSLTFMFVFGLQTEIFQNVYCLIVQFSSVTSQNLLLFSFAKPPKNNIFAFFSRFSVQILMFKVEYLENGLAVFNDFGLILQDFERPFR